VQDITEGKGVDVVYDSVGKDTIEGSMACLRPFGLLVSFGQSSGKIPPFDIAKLMTHGSIYLTRPTLMDHIRERSSLQQSASRVFAAYREGAVTVDIHQRYQLRNIKQAHIDLEARTTTGSSVILP
jgi:NADPH2:quinone reductase